MPASFLTNSYSPHGAIGTPVRAPGASNTSQDALANIYTRADEIVQNNNECNNFIQELTTRYAYISQEYETLVQERKAYIGWQKEKDAYDEQLRSMTNALERNPFVIVLVDGDGMIFRDEYIRQGEQGGRQAAAELYAAIIRHVHQQTTHIPTTSRVVCRIYANVAGLAETLVRNAVIEEVSVFEEFVRGFTRCKTLFDFVDVGSGKDRADGKVIETLKLFIGNFHCRHIFFGCSHDNGFARALEELMTEAHYVSKITLLEGVPFEKELQALPYDTMKFAGIFRDIKLGSLGAPNGIGAGSPMLKNYNMIAGLPSRLPSAIRSSSAPDRNWLLDSPTMAKVATNLPRTPSSSTLASDGMPAIKPAPAMNWAAKAAAPPPPRAAEEPEYRPANREEVIARNRAGQRIDPPCRDYDKAEVDRIKKVKMCNVHFLRNECPFGQNCTHLHKYEPTANELAVLRLVARMAPCQYGSNCQDIKCIYGHRCPAPPSRTNHIKGTKTCIFGESCKFPPELHDIDCNVVKTLVPDQAEAAAPEKKSEEELSVETPSRPEQEPPVEIPGRFRVPLSELIDRQRSLNRRPRRKGR